MLRTFSKKLKDAGFKVSKEYDGRITINCEGSEDGKNVFLNILPSQFDVED